MRKLTQHIFLVCFLCFFLIIKVFGAEDNTIQKESLTKDLVISSNNILDFVPQNYSILDSVQGDLNFDGISDYILVLKRNGVKTLSDVVDHPEKRPLLILLHKLHLIRRNDNTVYCVDCGGMMGAPFTGITIKNGYFLVEHYGGSAWRWTRIITYKYSVRDKEQFLHRDGYESFHVSDMEKIKTIMKTKKDFGLVKFENFDIYDR